MASPPTSHFTSIQTASSKDKIVTSTAAVCGTTPSTFSIASTTSSLYILPTDDAADAAAEQARLTAAIAAKEQAIQAAAAAGAFAALGPLSAEREALAAELAEATAKADAAAAEAAAKAKAAAEERAAAAAVQQLAHDDVNHGQPEMIKTGDRCARFATIAAIALAVGAFLGLVLAISASNSKHLDDDEEYAIALRGARRRLLDGTTEQDDTQHAEAVPEDSDVKAFVRSNVVGIVAATAGFATVVALTCWWARARSHDKVDDFVPPPTRPAPQGSGGGNGWWRDPSFVQFIFRRAGVNATSSDVEMVTRGDDPLAEAEAGTRSTARAHPVRSRTMRWQHRGNSSYCGDSDCDCAAPPSQPAQGGGGGGGGDGGGDGGPPSLAVSRSWVRAVAPALPAAEAHSASWLEEQTGFARAIDEFELEAGLSRAGSYLSLVSDSTPE